ncbi:MAG: hypothetical protein D6780_05665, partial [Candidatus Dadabacteria bacterium]
YCAPYYTSANNVSANYTNNATGHTSTYGQNSAYSFSSAMDKKVDRLEAMMEKGSYVASVKPPTSQHSSAYSNSGSTNNAHTNNKALENNSLKTLSQAEKNLIGQRLLRLLSREIELYSRYLKLTKEQKNAVSFFKREQLEKLNKERSLVLEAIEEAHNQRLLLLKPFNHNKRRLTDIVQTEFSAGEWRDLQEKAFALKKIALEARAESERIKGVIQFAVDIVNGSLSLIWQLTQSVTRIYSRKGQVKEKRCPRYSREERVLKKA